MSISTINIIFSEDCVCGKIVDFNLKQRTCRLVTSEGERIVCHFSALVGKDLIEALKDNLHVRGTMIKDHSTVRQMIIKSLTLLGAQNVPSRVQELCLLQNGWLDGEGKALPKDGAQWFIEAWSKEWPSTMKNPYTYPALDNDLQLEWSSSDLSMSARIDLGARSAYVHVCNLKDRFADALEADLNLDTSEGWSELIRFAHRAAA